MEQAKRKANRLKTYDYSRPGAYFVTICTQERRCILCDIVGDVVAWLKYTATKEINRETGTSGQRIFQRSFHDHVVRSEEDYRKIWEYIGDNPRRWTEDRYYAE